MQLQYPQLRYCASLGGIRTSMKQAVLAKKTGYVKGFPDMQICKVNSKYAGLFLEIKADKTCYPSKEQKQWVERDLYQNLPQSTRQNIKRFIS